jgi:hypothetical protein
MEKEEVVTNCDHLSHLKFAAALPNAFTEQGAIMAANVLQSDKAVAMSVYVVRAFVKMREMLNATSDLARQLKELEAKLKSRLDVHETAIVEVLQRIMDILKPAPEPAEPPHKEIGFHIKEDSLPYRIKRPPRSACPGTRLKIRTHG